MKHKVKCDFCTRTRFKIYKVLFEKVDEQVRSHKWICGRCLKEKKIPNLLEQNSKCESSSFTTHDDLK